MQNNHLSRFAKEYFEKYPDAPHYHPSTFMNVVSACLFAVIAIACIGGLPVIWMLLFQSPLETGKREFLKQQRRALAKNGH
jgi:hypothetical protein